MRAMGVCLRKNCMNSGVRLFMTASVAVMPGHTTLQVMLSFAAWTAIILLRWMMAALLVP